MRVAAGARAARACVRARVHISARVGGKKKEEKKRGVRFLSHDATVPPLLLLLLLQAGCQWQHTYNEVRRTSNNIHQPNQQAAESEACWDRVKVSEAESATRQDGRHLISWH